MGDTNRVLPLGLVYKRYNSAARGYLYYIIQKIEHNSELSYEQLVTTKFSDHVASITNASSSSVLSDLVSEEEGGKEQKSLPAGRYPGTHHLSPEKSYFLSAEEFKDFAKYHPHIKKQLKKQKGIKRLVRVG